MSASKTATLLRQMVRSGGDVRLYRLSPPAAEAVWDNDTQDYTVKPVEFVVVSAAVIRNSGPETYIFASDESGNITDWVEMTGSFRGGLDHAKALRGAGYEVAP